VSLIQINGIKRQKRRAVISAWYLAESTGAATAKCAEADSRLTTTARRRKVYRTHKLGLLLAASTLPLPPVGSKVKLLIAFDLAVRAVGKSRGRLGCPAQAQRAISQPAPHFLSTVGSARRAVKKMAT